MFVNISVFINVPINVSLAIINGDFVLPSLLGFLSPGNGGNEGGVKTIEGRGEATIINGCLFSPPFGGAGGRLYFAPGGLFHFSFKFNHLSELQEIVFGPDLYFFGISDKWQNVCLYLIDVSSGKTFVQLFKE